MNCEFRFVMQQHPSQMHRSICKWEGQASPRRLSSWASPEMRSACRKRSGKWTLPLKCSWCPGSQTSHRFYFRWRRVL